jgi:hypothetical protein
MTAALGMGGFALLAGGPVQADLGALMSRLTAPPPKALLIDVSKDSIGGLRLNAPASAYVNKLGIPDYIGALESKSMVEMLWSRTANPKSGWATATLRNPSSTTVTELRFAGAFRTLQGDRHGTALSTFLKHWRLQGPVVTGVVNDGVLIEYNVVVGGVVFAFDQHRILEAVGLAAPAAVERSLCVIPSACVVTKIR